MSTPFIEEVRRGTVTENPLLRLAASLCPSMAVCLSVGDAAVMSAALAIVLIGTNATVSLVRRILGERTRFLCAALIAATFATAASLLAGALVPATASRLGVYVPLLAMNALVLLRAERFALQATMVASIVDGIVLSAGFALSLCAVIAVREVAGAGALAGVNFSGLHAPLPAAALPAVGLILLGCAAGLAQALHRGKGAPKK